MLLILSLSIHALIILPLLAKIFGKFSGYKFLNKMRQPLILALTTASSNAALPVSLKTLKQPINDPIFTAKKKLRYGV